MWVEKREGVSNAWLKDSSDAVFTLLWVSLGL